MKTLSTIALILPYFGKLPKFFSVFLESCRQNPTVTWLVFTDDKNAESDCGNVKIVPMTFEEMRSRAQAVFDFKICLNRPYKLCDFKPAYGLIFADFLKDFDFWGYCDCDLIWGNLRKFLTEEILGKYDRILSRGHLSIYRNVDSVNRFFMRGDYKRALMFPQPFSFDEWGGTSKLWAQESPEKFYDQIIFDDINSTKKHFVSSQKFVMRKTDFPDEPRKNVCFIWRAGTLFRVFDGGKDETLYAHFQKRPMEIKVGVPAKTAAGTGFVFVPDQVLPYGERFENDSKFRSRYCRSRWIYWPHILRRTKNLLRKIKIRLGIDVYS